MDGSFEFDRLSTIESIEEEELEFERNLLRERARLLWKKFKSNLKAAMTLKNIANAVFVLGVCIMCVQQCYSQVNEYLKFSTRIQVTHSFPTSTLDLMPGVTICNNNRIRMDRLSSQITGLEERVKNVSSHITRANFAFIPRRKRTEYFTSIKRILDEFINITDIINESPIADLLELSRSTMINDVNCNLLWGKPFNCENFRIVESYQSAPCYTMFYVGSVLEAVANGKAYEFNTSLLGGQRKVDSFASHEIAEILIDFEPLEHADYQRDAGGKIIIHSTSQIGSVRDTAHTILPGNNYDFIIGRQITKRLPPPYKSMCFDYMEENSSNFTLGEGVTPSVELDKTTCIRNCILRQTIKECNCWPIEIPYYLGDTSIINDSEIYKRCPWGFEDEKLSHSSEQYVDCYRRFLERCRVDCRKGCTVEDYKVHVMSTSWPSKEMFFRAVGENQKRDLQTLKGCCARISLKYIEFMENRHLMYPNITFVQLVSNVGGIVSALVGVSAVTVYRYVTRKIFRCKVVSDYVYVPPGSRMRGQLKRSAIGAKFCKQIAKVAPTTTVADKAQ